MLQFATILYINKSEVKIMENIRELFQVMTRRFGLLNKNCCQVGGEEISLVQSHILYEILQKDRPSMQQVADTLAMDITTFSRQIQTLVKFELVKKTPLPEDKRVSQLTLTTQGKYVAAKIDADMNQYLNEVFSNMSEFEREMVIKSIKLLNEAMSKSTVCCKPLF
jgi:DNA-binding MarR family transcriptional regulator